MIIYLFKLIKQWIRDCSLLTLIIFVICIIIEMIRKWIFKIIYNTKLAEKNRNWYRNYIKELGININW